VKGGLVSFGHTGASAVRGMRLFSHDDAGL